MMLPEHEPVALQIVGGIGEIERLALCGILGRGHLVLPAAQPFGCPRLTHEGEGLRDDKGEILPEQGIHLSRARQRGIFPDDEEDRKSVVSGKSVSVRVDLGERRLIKQKRISYQSRTSSHYHIHLW